MENLNEEILISRQAAIDAFYKYPNVPWTTLDILEKINSLPPVTAEKVGHWIYDKLRYWNGGCKYECSECGMGSNMNYAYCMRCGCKMQEREE